MINQLKSKLFSSRRVLEKSKFIVHRAQVLEFWQDMSLLDKERLLYISNNTVLECVGVHINSCLTNRKFREQYPAYYIKQAGQYALSVYDCIVYRWKADDKEMREIVTAFMLIYKHKPVSITNRVQQVISNDIITSSLLKVKASYILRLIGFFAKYIKDYLHGEKVLIRDDGYGVFISLWLNRKHYADLGDYIKDVFEGVLILLENQLIRAFVESQDPTELQNRKYTEPTRLLVKPKNKACFTTTTESLFGKVDWPSLSLNIFRLRYRVVQSNDHYMCFKEGPEDFDSESDPEQVAQYSEEDRLIAGAFKQYKWLRSSLYYHQPL